MIPIENFIEDAIRKLRKLEVYSRLDIRTYKKDRSIVIEKLEEGYNLYEDGFEKEEFKNLSQEELKKLLKVLQRKNMVRFYVLEGKDVR